MYCCTFGCIENHWTIEKRRKVSWQKLKNSKHPCFAYLAGRVAYHIALGLFLLFAFLQENIWYLTLLTENSDRKVDTGGLGCNRCSLWHPILLAWTYFCSQKRPSQGEIHLARRWHTVTEEQIKNSIPNSSVKKKHWIASTWQVIWVKVSWKQVKICFLKSLM